jgi:hypothetical protein
MLYKSLAMTLLLGLLALSCGDESDRFERIDKLRGIGVRTTTPTIVNPSAEAGQTTVTLSFFYALPKGQRLSSIEFMKSDSTAYSSFITGEISGDPTYREIGSLELVEIPARLSISRLNAGQFAAFRGLIRLRFGLHAAVGSDSEDMISEVRVVADAADPALSWKPHTLSLSEPTGATATAGSLNLAATLTKAQEETVKVSWFVSSGKIKNSRALTSTWSEMSKGKQTVILAIYPRKSLFFELTTHEIEMQ